MSLDAWSKVVDLPLRTRDKFVLLTLAELADQGGVAEVPINSIVQRTGIPPEKVLKALGSLQARSFKIKVSGFIVTAMLGK